MYAEAVRDDTTPSKPGLRVNQGHRVKCSECDVTYLLHYDDEADALFIFCSILADEIVTARHPDHAPNVVLDPVALDRTQQGKTRVVWSSRISLSTLLKKNP
jgi:hypothetical protein